MPAETTPTPPVELANPTLRSFVSLALLLHLLCVAFVFSANVDPSRLQRRLAGVLAPYTQLLHLDPGGARLQFTDGREPSDDHILIVAEKMSDGATADADAVRFPPQAAAMSPQRRRLLGVASEMAAFAEDDSLAALFARSVGASVMRSQGWDHVIVRVEHKGPQPLYDDTPEIERSSDYVVYEAEVWLDEDGELQVQKRTTGLQAAPTSREGGA
jgi:hypothetical protein